MNGDAGRGSKFRAEVMNVNVFGFNKAHADAVVTACSKDETRYNLNAVRLECGALVATDGHRLHRIVTNAELNAATTHRDAPRTTAEGYEPANTVHIALADFDRIRKAMRKGDFCVVEYHDADDAPGTWRATITGGASIEFKPLDVGEWCNYRAVMPLTREHAFTAKVDARKLRALCDAAIKASELGSRELVPVRLDFGDELAPILITGEFGGFDGVLMGLRR